RHSRESGAGVRVDEQMEARLRGHDDDNPVVPAKAAVAFRSMNRCKPACAGMTMTTLSFLRKRRWRTGR
ncbi:MAG TPA: hypothetical protein VGK87_07855, partial [Anaerolineae bacterium]